MLLLILIIFTTRQIAGLVEVRKIIDELRVAVENVTTHLLGHLQYPWIVKEAGKPVENLLDLLFVGNPVCKHVLHRAGIHGESKIKGDFVQYLGYKDGVLGSVEPGMLYKETLAARNGQDIPVYVRMTVRKYWVEVNEDGTAGDKTTVLAPKYIHLTYGNEDYNKDEWTLDKSVSTEESKTYYCKKAIEPNGDSAELFDQLIIDNKLTERSEDEVTEGDNGVTTIKYVYKYDGYAFMIEADVQAIQTHNANEAIESQWGVKNVKAEGGTLTVR